MKVSRRDAGRLNLTCCADGSNRSKNKSSCVFRLTAYKKNESVIIKSYIFFHSCSLQTIETVRTSRVRNSSIKVLASVGSSVLDNYTNTSIILV